MPSYDYDGGELSLELEEGLGLNYQLRIPTRILLRLDEFKARDFPKLFKKMSKIEWRHWLWSEDVDIKVSTGRSRLIHSGKIAQSALWAIKKSLKAQPFSIKFANYYDFSPQVYIRIDNDIVSVSIDTSYPPLYKRSHYKEGHQASIRENLAYASWSCLKQYIDQPEFNLIDPMCGSGTYLWEALKVYQREQFAFQGFPVVQKHHNQLRLTKNNKAEALINAYGFDIDKSYIHNNKSQKNTNIKWAIQDLFDSENSTNITGHNIVIVNPPYNKRIKIDKKINDILIAIKTQYSPQLIGIIIPRDQLSQAKLDDYQIVDSIDFRNGGFPCRFIVFKRD